MAKDMRFSSYPGKLRLEKLSPFLFAISSASLLWYLTHSSGIPPVVVKTRGVKVPCSISITLLLVLMLLVDLLRSQVSVRVFIRMTHPNVEECRSLSLPKTWSMNIQTGIRSFVSAMI